MDEWKPSEKFVGTLRVQAGFHHYELNRTRVPTAEAPSLASAIGFQDRVAKTEQNQGSCHESGCIIFDKQNSLHRALRLTDRRRGYRLLATNRIHTGISVVDVEHSRCGKQRINVWKIAS